MELLTSFTGSHVMPPFMMCPRGLRKWKLNGTELMLYLAILDRVRLSERHNGWRDERGRIWCYYPVRALASDLDRGESAVKSGLRSLEKKGLLERERQGQGKPDRLFITLLWEDEEPAQEEEWWDVPDVCWFTFPGDSIPADPPAWESGHSEEREADPLESQEPDPPERRESDPPERRESDLPAGGNPPPSNNYIRNKERESMREQKRGSNTPAREPRRPPSRDAPFLSFPGKRFLFPENRRLWRDHKVFYPPLRLSESNPLPWASIRYNPPSRRASLAPLQGSWREAPER